VRTTDGGVNTASRCGAAAGPFGSAIEIASGAIAGGAHGVII